MTTPNVCARAITTVTTLRTVGMRRRSSRSGRVGIARALSRSVGRTSGRCASGGDHRPRGASSPRLDHTSTCTPRSTAVTAVRSPPVAEPALRPFNARSLVLSILLGLDPPTLPARSLVAVGELFGIAGGTVRTALSRMVAAGELTADGDGYRLVGRLLERKAAQDIGRRPASDAGTARGGWPSSRRRAGRSPSAGRSARTWPTCAWASCDRTRGCARPTSTDRRASRRWPWFAASSAARTRRSWPLGCGRSPRWPTTPTSCSDASTPSSRRSPPAGRSATGDHAGRRGRPPAARRAAAAAVADTAAVAGRRAPRSATARSTAPSAGRWPPPSASRVRDQLGAMRRSKRSSNLA